MSGRLKVVSGLLALLALAGCDVPRDPEGTLSDVRGKTLIVGVNDGNEPADERERAVLERFAESVNADISYHRAEFHRLAADLKNGRIHVIAGHLPKTTPFSKEIGLSVPVSSMELDGERVETVFAVRKGENGLLTSLETALGEVR